ncbi:MAG: TIGR03943 family protein [Anaerolineales bacterium]|uniref:TIGR03943 family putative permease subunit n=1 Tax=Candidatus Villigracilis vicinus TaxID=3140679 RepID=UPI0031347D44|nr:TIGR03943 family protein [Anaerolineales bacterium]
MPQRMFRSYQGLLLFGLCIFFVLKAVNGQLTWYINSRFVPLTIIGILFLALLAQTLFSEIRRSRQHELEHPEHHHEHDHAPSSVTLWVMLIPLAIGLLIPARPLDSSAFSTKGFNTSAPLVSSDSSASIFETESQERNILQWLKLFNYQDDITEFIGQEASVVGFVYFDEDTLEADQFFVSRFVVSCCSADGFAIAMPVRWSNASELQQDSWVVVKGSIASIELDGQRTPMITAESVEAVNIPDQPYLYP